MKAIIEPAAPDTKMLKSRPLWIAVDKITSSVQVKIPTRSKGDEKFKTVNETSVRCYIGVIDYRNKEEAEIIAKIIEKAINEYKGKI